MANEIKRMNYYNGLFLKEEDFINDQEYHIRMRRLMNWHLNQVYGILEGLEVIPVVSEKKYKVTAGIALSFSEEEWKGVEVVLTDDKVVDISGASQGDYYLIIAYNEEKTDIVPDKGSKEIHISERPRLELKSTQSTPDKKKEIVLARISVPATAWTSDKISIDTGERRVLGPAIRSVNGKTGIGTSAPVNVLDVEGGAVIGTAYSGNNTAPANGLLVEGKVGIGIAVPVGKLQVSGGAIMPSPGNSENAGIMFPKDAFGGAGDAAWMRYYARSGEATTLEIGIANDADDHIALMSSGNVGIGTIAPLAKLQVAGGAIMPSPGNSENAGIMFPKDAFGGAGDAAWMRYYARSGEATTLEIGIANDADDHIALMSSGNVGIGTVDPQAKLDVNGKIKAISFEGDGSKLTGISTGASSQWGDAAGGLIYYNKGDVMIGGGDLRILALDTYLDFGSDVRQMINLCGTAPNASYGIGVQAATQYYRTAAHFAWYQGGTHSDAELDPGAGGAAVMVIKRGNVGIGTPTPVAKLQVDGDILATDGMDNIRKTIDLLQNNKTLRSGIYQNSGDGLRNAAGTAVALPNWWHVINMHHQDNNGFSAQIAVPLSVPAALNEIFFRTSGGGTWAEWRKVLSENSAGNVGIGTTAPLARLQVAGGAIMPSVGNSDSAGIMFPRDPFGGSGDAAWMRYYARSGESTTLEIGIANDADDHIALMSSGNVGIGTIAPVNKLDVSGDIAILGKHAFRGSDTWLRLNQDGAFPAGVHTPGVFAPSSLNVGGAAGWGNPGGGNVWIVGTVGVGTSSPAVKFHVVGNRIRLSKGNGHSIDLRADGAAMDIESIDEDIYINNSSNTAVRIRNYVAISTREVKENFAEFSSIEALEAFEALQPIKYNYKGDNSGNVQLGFIAEDVSTIAATRDRKGINPMALIAILTRVVKEQQQNISALQKAIKNT